jgi:serine/threonine protein kinase
MNVKKIRIIGIGSFADVFQGKINDTEIAIKHRKNDDIANVARFNKECEILKSLNHINILKYVDQDDKHLYTELQDFDLSKIINSICTTEKDQDRSDIMLDVAKGLDYIHNRPNAIIHRDLKPENIFIKYDKFTDTFRTVIGDFGLAVVADETGKYTSIKIAGSAIFMAPEIIISEKGAIYSAASDIWAYGVIYWNIITGKEPYSEATDLKCFRHNLKNGSRLNFKDIQGDAKLFALIEQTWSNTSNRPIAKKFIEYLTISSNSSNKKRKLIR